MCSEETRCKDTNSFLKNKDFCKKVDAFSESGIFCIGNYVGFDPTRFLLHRVRNLFPPQALHPLANGLFHKEILLKVRY